jgi:adenosylcobinamide-phosphate synthase
VTFAVVVIAIIVDALLGEPKRFHPLVGFGLFASKIENMLNRNKSSQFLSLSLGAVSWFLFVVFPVLMLLLLFNAVSYSHPFLFLSEQTFIDIAFIIDVLVLYFVVGHKSLRQHAFAIYNPLIEENLEKARKNVGMIVSRDTTSLDEDGIRKATVESVLENGNDAIFAPIFWFIVGGAPAALIYRLANTLDAMWGYKTDRFLFFGRFAARMDDILNWLPSRLVGLSYSLLGDTKNALQCWREQAHLLESPNAGVVMTAGAGALNVKLGGDTIYHGEIKKKAVFGCGKSPANIDIYRSVRLILNTLILWVSLVLCYQIIYTIRLANA